MNKGGFSVKRFIGISRIKSQISRDIGIPLTRSGRQRKVGKMLIGNNCLVIILTPIFVLVMLGFIIL